MTKQHRVRCKAGVGPRLIYVVYAFTYYVLNYASCTGVHKTGNQYKQANQYVKTQLMSAIQIIVQNGKKC